MRLQYSASSPASWPLAVTGVSPCLLPGPGAAGSGGCYGALLFFLWSSAALAAGVSGGAAVAAGGGGGAVTTGAPPATSDPPAPVPAARDSTGGAAAALPPSSGAAAGAGSLCYSSPSEGSVQELAQRSRVVVEGRVQAQQPGGAVQGGTQEAAPSSSTGHSTEHPPTFTGTSAAPSAPSPSPQPAAPAAYLVKVHQVWAVKAGGLRKDSLIWVLGDFGPCLRLKEDSKYIFFMEPNGTGNGLFQASFPPLETGRNLKKEVSRVLCRGCA